VHGVLGANENQVRVQALVQPTALPVSVECSLTASYNEFDALQD
jgi:hypothetical protein